MKNKKNKCNDVLKELACVKYTIGKLFLVEQRNENKKNIEQIWYQNTKMLKQIEFEFSVEIKIIPKHKNKEKSKSNAFRISMRRNVEQKTLVFEEFFLQRNLLRKRKKSAIF